VIHLDKNIVILNETIVNKPIPPLSEIVLDFLEQFSKELKSHPLSKLYPDILTLSFWCRKKNLLKLCVDENRIGWGVVFHITPSNVPINFILSYIYALLGGNSSIVRIPSKHYPQTDIILSVLKNLFLKYPTISKMSSFIYYKKDDLLTTKLSNLSNVRIIWGGDEAIQNIKKLPTKPKLIDIEFADRYSISILQLNNHTDFKNLAKRFYNDTYLMDQNGCSSPHLIFWYNTNKKDIFKFYKALDNVAKTDYKLSNIMVMDKFTKISLDAIHLDNIEFHKFSNYLYVVTLNNLDTNISKLRGQGGYFYDYQLSNLDEIAHIINEKFQTITYYGVDKNSIKNLIFKYNLLGIDRIVPVGSGFEIDTIWDGYDIIKSISRKIRVI